MKFKIVITLTYDNVPLDAPIDIYIDDQYFKTLYTENGYVEDIIDVFGRFIKAVFKGTADYEPAEATKPLLAWDIPGAIGKYKVKLHHVRLRRVLSIVIPKTHEKGLDAQVQVQTVINKVKPILDRLKIPLELRLSYYAYSLALDRSQREYAYMVDRIREHQILRSKWESRGLNPDVLDQIDKLLIWRKS